MRIGDKCAGKNYRCQMSSIDQKTKEYLNTNLTHLSTNKRTGMA